MTFRDLVYQEETNMLPSFRTEREKTLWEVILEENGPVMKLWFVVMLVNIIGFVVLFQ